MRQVAARAIPHPYAAHVAPLPDRGILSTGVTPESGDGALPVEVEV